MPDGTRVVAKPYITHSLTHSLQHPGLFVAISTMPYHVPTTTRSFTVVRTGDETLKGDSLRDARDICTHMQAAVIQWVAFEDRIKSFKMTIKQGECTHKILGFHS